MKNFKDVLVWKYNACPPNCRFCEEACAQREGAFGSAIQEVDIPEVDFHGVIACIQCSTPRCAEICPTGALVKDEKDEVVRLQQEKCVGCGLCTLECPYGGIYYNSEKQKSIKCDTCNNDPKCVPACPYGVLEFLRNSELQRSLHDEDLLSPGVRTCPGCVAELALRLTLRVLGRDSVLFGAPGCMLPAILGSDIRASTKLTTFPCLFTNVMATMTGVYRVYRQSGKRAHIVAFVGDGCIADIGFQSLSGAAERGENLIVIVYDNEGYMNTGIQRSSTTPIHAWTTTSPVNGSYRGKPKKSKYVPLIMLAHDIPYVATASIAYLGDYFQKLTKAMAVRDGLAYIHLFSPCPTGWRAPMDSAITISRLAVETNYFPLWEAEHGKLRLTKEILNPKPVHELARQMGKFSHLRGDELEQLQDSVNHRFDMIKSIDNRNREYELRQEDIKRD